jgi:hypothetical protein
MALLSYKWFLIGLLSLTGWQQVEKLEYNRSQENATIWHPFYISVVEINHNNKEQSIEISCKIFADDMEDILKKNYKTAVDLSSAKQIDQNNKLINDYITKNLSFNIDGKTAKLNYIGFEKDKESVYGYFEITLIPAFKKLEVANSVLHDFNDQQINIMHVTVNGNRKSYKLDYPNKQASFSF